MHTFCVTGLIRPAASVEADPVSLGDDLLSLATAHQLQRALSTMPNMRAASTYSVSACVECALSVRWVNVLPAGLARGSQVHSARVGKAASSEHCSTTAAVAFFCRPGASCVSVCALLTFALQYPGKARRTQSQKSRGERSLRGVTTLV